MKLRYLIPLMVGLVGCEPSWRDLYDPRPDGTYEDFWRNGQLRMRITFSEGLPVYVENYHKNGQLFQKGRSPIGPDGRTIREGLHEMYREDGEVIFRGFYSEGLRCGEWIDTNPTHPIDSRGQFVRDPRGQWSEDGETVTYPPCPNG